MATATKPPDKQGKSAVKRQHHVAAAAETEANDEDDEEDPSGPPTSTRRPRQREPGNYVNAHRNDEGQVDLRPAARTPPPNTVAIRAADRQQTRSSSSYAAAASAPTQSPATQDFEPSPVATNPTTPLPTKIKTALSNLAKRIVGHEGHLIPSKKYNVQSPLRNTTQLGSKTSYAIAQHLIKEANEQPQFAEEINSLLLKLKIAVHCNHPCTALIPNTKNASKCKTHARKNTTQQNTTPNHNTTATAAAWEKFTENHLMELNHAAAKAFPCIRGRRTNRRTAALLNQIWPTKADRHREDNSNQPAAQNHNNSFQQIPVAKREAMALWILLAMVAVPHGPTPEQRHKHEVHTIDKLWSGEWETVHNNIKSWIASRADEMSKHGIDEGVFNLAQENKVAQGNAARVLDDNPPTPVLLSLDDAEEMIKKQFPAPTANTPSIPITSPQDQPRLEVTEADIRKQFKRISHATGPAGNSMKVWTAMLQHTGRLSVQLLQRIVGDVLNNDIKSQTVRTCLTGTNLTILKTELEDGKHKLRAVGGLAGITHMAQRIAYEKISAEATEYLKNTPEMSQRKGGLASTVQTLMHAYQQTQVLKDRGNAAQRADAESFAILAIDVQGAYPHAPRSIILQRVKEYFPTLYRLTYFMLANADGNKHRLLRSDGQEHHITQQHGILQGAYLSGFLFNLITLCAIGHYPKKDDQPNAQSPVVPNTNLRKYFDDMFIHGTVDECIQHMKTLQAKLGEIGLTLAPHKSKLFMPHASRNSSQEIANQHGLTHVEPDAGLLILGVPVGTDDYIRQHLQQRAQNHIKAVQRATVTLSHQGLMQCFQHAQSMMQHYFASIQPNLTRELAETLDTFHTEHFLQTYFHGVDAKDWAGNPAEGKFAQSDLPDTINTNRKVIETKIQAPLKLGGFGVYSLSDRRNVAFCIAAAQTWSDCHKDITRTPLKDDAGGLVRDHKQKPILPTTSLTDQRITKLAEDKSKILREEAKTIRARSKVRVVDAALDRIKKNINDIKKWINTPLCQSIHSPTATDLLLARRRDTNRRMKNDEYIFAIRRIMGFGIAHMIGTALNKPCALCLGDHASPDQEPKVDPKHVQVCPNAGRIRRHNKVQHAVRNMCIAAGLPTRLEEVSTSKSSKQRLDIVCPGGNIIYGNQPAKSGLAIDVTVVYKHDKQTDKAKLKAAEQLKHATYKTSFSEDNDCKIVPFAVSATSGALGESAKELISKLQQAATVAGHYIPKIDERFDSKWRAIIACTLWKAQWHMAKSVIDRTCLADSVGNGPDAVLQSS